MRAELVAAVLARLAVDRPALDVEGLRSVYRAWCRAVPFDNTLKLIHCSEGLPGPLPGSTPEAFFDPWLAHGTGGTCWAGNGALYGLLEMLGFDVDRAIATMLPRPDIVGPNHGSVIVAVDGTRWITDASILSGEPIAIPEPGVPAATGPVPRFEWLDGKPAVRWRMLRVPAGFLCRIDRIGAGCDEWDALHRRTAEWSPFNYQLSARLIRDNLTIGAEIGQRFAILPDGTIERGSAARARASAVSRRAPWHLGGDRTPCARRSADPSGAGAESRGQSKVISTRPADPSRLAATAASISSSG